MKKLLDKLKAIEGKKVAPVTSTGKKVLTEKAVKKNKKVIKESLDEAHADTGFGAHAQMRLGMGSDEPEVDSLRDIKTGEIVREFPNGFPPFLLQQEKQGLLKQNGKELVRGSKSAAANPVFHESAEPDEDREYDIWRQEQVDSGEWQRKHGWTDPEFKKATSSAGKDGMKASLDRLAKGSDLEEDVRSSVSRHPDDDSIDGYCIDCGGEVTSIRMPGSMKQISPCCHAKIVSEKEEDLDEDIDTVCKSGYDAGRSGKPCKNPYPHGTQENRKWEREYAAAQSDSMSRGGLGESKGKVIKEKSTSPAQARLMAGAAHDPKFAKKVGVKQSVAKEFNKADTGTKLLSKAMKKPVTESKVAKKQTTFICEGVKFKVSDPKLARILHRFPHEVINFQKDGELDDVLYDKLYNYWFSQGEMAHGIAKARDGDPYEWVADRLERELNGGDFGHPSDFMEDSSSVDPELQEILDTYPAEMDEFNLSGDLDDSSHFYDDLYHYYTRIAANKMPYDVARARVGNTDPVQWITTRLEQDTGGLSEGVAGDMMPRESIGDDLRPSAKRDSDIRDEDFDDESFDHAEFAAQKAAYERSPRHSFNDDDAYEPGHYKRSDYMDRFDEDSLDPTPSDPDEKVLVEYSEDAITSKLENLGLDYGLDFFFDGGLTVIGRSTARVVTNAIPGAAIESIDGEEVRITFNKRDRAMTSTRDIDDLSRIPELSENINLNISADGEEDVISVIKKLSGLHSDPLQSTVSFAASPGQCPTMPPSFSSLIDVVADHDEYDLDGLGEGEETDYCNQPDPRTHTSTRAQMNTGDKNQRSTQARRAQPGDNALAVVTDGFNNRVSKSTLL